MVNDLSCHLQNIADDIKVGENDWTYVDALMVCQELNAQSPFAGDAAMRAMYGGH